MATTKETKPLFVYWGGRKFKQTSNDTEMVSVSYFSEKGYKHPNYMSGFSSEVVENLHDESWDDLDEKAPITLTVEKGGPNSNAKDGFYWNLLAIEQGHDSEIWEDGAPEETQAPAPTVTKKAPADDMTGAISRDELDNAANTASRIYSAYIMSSETVVEFNEDRFAELIVKNFKGIAKAKQTILNERSAR